MSKFFLKWFLLIMAAYLAYQNRKRLWEAVFGFQLFRQAVDSKWVEQMMSRIKTEPERT